MKDLILEIYKGDNGDYCIRDLNRNKTYDITSDGILEARFHDEMNHDLEDFISFIRNTKL